METAPKQRAEGLPEPYCYSHYFPKNRWCPVMDGTAVVEIGMGLVAVGGVANADVTDQAVGHEAIESEGELDCGDVD